MTKAEGYPEGMSVPQDFLDALRGGKMSEFITPGQLARSLAKEPIERWAPWLVLALEALETEAMNLDPDHPEGFEQTLEALRDAIDDRLTKRFLAG